MIDSGIGQPWPDAVLAALSQLKQGDLLEDPPFFYAAISAYAVHDQTKISGEPSTEEDIVVFNPSDSPRYGLITTQTCDIFEESLKPKQPWIHVVPAYLVDTTALGPGQQGLIQKHRVGHLVPLTGATLPSGFWVADLRLEVPLEKSWLVGRRAIEAFRNEDEYLTLARRLAGRRERPALAPGISEHVVGSLRELLKLKQRARLMDAARELRLFVAGTRLAPSSAQLIVVTDDVAPSEVRKLVNAWWTEAEVACQAAGLALLRPRFKTLRGLTAKEYVDSVPLDFAYLSPDL